MAVGGRWWLGIIEDDDDDHEAPIWTDDYGNDWGRGIQAHEPPQVEEDWEAEIVAEVSWLYIFCFCFIFLFLIYLFILNIYRSLRTAAGWLRSLHAAFYFICVPIGMWSLIHTMFGALVYIFQIAIRFLFFYLF